MNRRAFLGRLAAVAAMGSGLGRKAMAAIPKMKITRVRAYLPPNPNPLFNQSDVVVTVETDAGITGIGEGGTKDMLAPSAGRLIGRDPQHIEQLWQDMNRAFFYPAGRERTDAIGALDLALWDIKGKALGCPVHQLLGGAARNYCELYNTAGIIPGIAQGMSVRERARLTIEAGYRAFRFGAADAPANTTYNTRERLRHLREECEQARQGVGPDGDWVVDFHQRFDLSDAIFGCNEIETLAPFFVEDAVRTEAFLQDLPDPAQQGERSAGRGRRMGQPVGLQPPGGRALDRFRAGDSAQCRRYYGDDEDRGTLRDALRGHRAALHRTDCDRRTGALPEHVFGAGADGIQLPGPHAGALARLPRLQGWEAVSE